MKAAGRRIVILVVSSLLFLSCSPAPDHGVEVARHDGERHADEEDVHEEDHASLVTLSREAIETIGLRTVTVERRALADEIRATAVLEPNQYKLAHVSPRIAGRAIRVHAVLGQRIEKGGILAELDSIELGEKKAAFLQQRANLDVARGNHEREKRLFDRGISSEREHLEAKGELERTTAGFRAAREALRLVGLTGEEIERLTWGDEDGSHSHFPLTAPLGGKVIERHVTLGELVTPEDTPFTIADLSTVWILLSVYERDLVRVRLGQTAKIRLDALPDAMFEGTLTYLSDVVDPATRAAKARVEIPNPDGRLRPGMFARAVIVVPPAEQRETLVVPRSATQRIDETPVAFVVHGDGVFGVREIETGRTVGDVVEIVSGLSEGEKVVTEGAFHLKSELESEKMAGHSH